MTARLMRLVLLCAPLALVLSVIVPVAARSFPAPVPSRWQHFTMQGVSMAPTIRNNQIVWIDTAAYRHRRPRRGDIIVFRARAGGEPRLLFVKRVIGLPNDIVAIHNNSVFIDGRRMREHYVRYRASYTYGPRRVPPWGYFVLGDNRNNSDDSHLWPSPWVLARDIVGKVSLRR